MTTETTTIEAPAQTATPAPKAPTKPKAPTRPKAKPKATGKAKPKAKAKTSANGKPRASKKAPKPKAKTERKSRVNDDARLVAKASDGFLTPGQVRVLRALKGTKKNQSEMDRGDIKEAVGIGRDGKYSQKWLTELWDLEKHELISIFVRPSDGKGPSKHTHVITAKGAKALEKAEKAKVKA